MEETRDIWQEWSDYYIKRIKYIQKELNVRINNLTSCMAEREEKNELYCLDAPLMKVLVSAHSLCAYMRYIDTWNENHQGMTEEQLQKEFKWTMDELRNSGIKKEMIRKGDIVE